MESVRQLLPNETHVWFTEPWQLNKEQELGLLYSVLSSEEQARYWRFFIPRVRKEFCAAHALLRIALSQYVAINPSEWQFLYQPNGKPIISWPNDLSLYFNLTHTSTMVACVISHQPFIGIDVEDTGRAIEYEGIAQRIFSPQELEEFAAIEPPSKGRFFFTIWTLKEAFTKAMGLGLSMPVQNISFHVEPGKVLFNCTGLLDIPLEWYFDIHDVDEHRLAIAQADTKLQVSYHHLDLSNYHPGQ